MAKTSKTRKRSTPKKALPAPVVARRIPFTGERVRRIGTDVEYEITYVSPDAAYVHIGIPRTNFEHRNVAVSGLTFLEAECSQHPIPAHSIEIIAQRLAATQHTSCERLSSQIAMLHKYLRGRRIPHAALDELERLCHEHEQQWQAAIARILKMRRS